LGATVQLIAWNAVPWVILAAFLATTAESLVGATLQSQGLLTNEQVNFFNTTVGALLGAGFWWWIGS
jgi:uncharacterized membrane protein